MPKKGTAPRHVAIIMDGNGRWAKERGLPRRAGHRAGADAVQTTVEACSDLGIEFLTLYAFSSENWKRPKTEVKALMSLLERFLKEKTGEMHKKNVRLQAIGRLNDLPEKCSKALKEAIETTSQNTGVTLILALSYGAREEIIDGIKSVVRHVQEGHLDVGMLDPDIFAKHLYTRYYPDPDLLIRTSGEMRLSNFLLWQLSYTEMVILQKFWPDFSKQDLADACDAYNNRDRRFGVL